MKMMSPKMKYENEEGMLISEYKLLESHPTKEIVYRKQNRIMWECIKRNLEFENRIMIPRVVIGLERK